MKENWFETEYEDDQNGKSCCGPTVLYTSKKGLESLASELQRISEKNKLGRYEINIEDEDTEYSAPFSHIEIAEKPPKEENDTDWSWKPFIKIGSGVLSIALLALYGLIRITMDILS